MYFRIFSEKVAVSGGGDLTFSPLEFQASQGFYLLFQRLGSSLKIAQVASSVSTTRTRKSYLYRLQTGSIGCMCKGRDAGTQMIVNADVW